jgi:amino acid transporter
MNTTDNGGRQLRRELRFAGVVALSISIMAPTAAMALNGVSASGLIGRAAPLAFVFAAIGIAIVTVGFVHLARRFNHAGSIYAYCGAVLGPRLGFVAAWTLLGAYGVLACASMAEAGIFGTGFLSRIGVGTVNWAVVALPLGVIAVGVSFIDVKTVARSLLTIEGASVSLIILLVVVIFFKLIAGSAPEGQTLTVKAFDVPSGISASTVALAAVFGFLSFAGFEAAASMGEESINPRRDIPRALAIAVGAAAVFFIVVIYAQTVGFGVGTAGVKAFSGSESPLGDLSSMYVGNWLADLIDFGATASAFAAGLGCLVAASRLLFALGRDGFVSTKLGKTSKGSGAPYVSLLVVNSLALAGLAYMAIVGVESINAFFYPATIGALGLLVAYIAVSVAAIASMVREADTPSALALVPALAIALLGYVIYRNVYPAPEAPSNAFPYVVAAWVLIGCGIALAAAGLTKRIGAGLAHAEGFAAAGEDASANTRKVGV